jgi:hypothetical protein
MEDRMSLSDESQATPSKSQASARPRRARARKPNLEPADPVGGSLSLESDALLAAPIEAGSTRRESTRSAASRTRAGSPTGLAAFVGPDERRQLIAAAAYRKYLTRREDEGSPETDWLEAEAELAHRLREISSEAAE